MYFIQKMYIEAPRMVLQMGLNFLARNGDQVQGWQLDQGLLETGEVITISMTRVQYGNPINQQDEDHG